MDANAPREPHEPHEVTCPHCHRPFEADLIGAGGQQGYKCPHCRLFVPQERAEDVEEPAST